MLETDYLVIGGGIAGLTYALEVAQSGKVVVLSKKEATLSSTAWAQGGVAAVSDDEEDNYQLHIQDTLDAGAGLCRPEIVELVVREGPDRVEELIARGAQFDRAGDGYHLHKEGGHSRRRIYHAADSTGYEIQNTLLREVNAHPNIEVWAHWSAVDLITSEKLGLEQFEKNTVLGVYALSPEGQVEVVTAKAVLMATGGAGKIYLYTSNPDVASGDGIAMCFRAGVPVLNMEFFQFHPTCLFHPEAKSFLITEAMRGEGAHLKLETGERFMLNHDERAELAPRDVVARAIDYEMKKRGVDCVYLDIRHRGADFIKSHFPTIHSRCLEFGIDVCSEMIPVVPAAHYCCGGVQCDENGATVIDRLFIAGEVSCTGLHGGNRLASNSLLEGMVFAQRAAKASLDADYDSLAAEIPDWDYGSAGHSDEQVVITQNWDEVRRCMWNYVGIVRSTKRLERALRRVRLIRDEIEQYYWDFIVTSDLLELRNLSLVSELVIRSALKRHESRGLHYTLDYPEQLEEPEETKVEFSEIFAGQ